MASGVMTKTQAREEVRNMRAYLRRFEAAVTADDADALDQWGGVINGTAAILAEYAEERGS